MSSYHQMGHDSWNLIPADGLSRFAGLILSPVNGDLSDTIGRLESIANRESLDIILDPQFYIPRSGRGALPSWPYFDPACDSTDLSNISWWHQRCDSLARAAVQLGVPSVCSPAVLPRTFDLSYYELTMECAHALAGVARKGELSVLLTAVVSLRDLATRGTSERIASLLTRSDLKRVYLIFFDDLTARQQWTDVDALVGGMALIRYLEQAGM